MVAGFVAMHIVAYYTITGYVFGFGKKAIGQLHGKQAIEVGGKPFFAPHHLYHGGRLVGYVEAIVPGIAFYKAGLIGVQHVYVYLKGAIAHFGAHKAQGGVVYVFVVSRPFGIFGIGVLLVQFFGHLGYAPVVVGIFQGLAHR